MSIDVNKSSERQAAIPHALRDSLLRDAGRVLVLAAGGYLVVRIALGLLHLS
jgi:hypothetical protein